MAARIPKSKNYKEKRFPDRGTTRPPGDYVLTRKDKKEVVQRNLNKQRGRKI